jgi:hypothetical protein
MEYALKYSLFIILLLTLFQSAYGVQTVPKRIWEHTFTSPVTAICKRHVADLPVNQKDRFPIQAVMTHTDVTMFNTKGTVSNIVSLQNYDKCKMASDTFIIAGLKNKQIHIFRSNNEQMSSFQIAEPQPVVLPQHLSFELSPDGQYLVIVSWFSKHIYFYSNDGQLRQKDHRDDLKNTQILFSKNGRQVFIHVPNYGDGHSSGYLLCYDHNGNLDWQFNHEGCKARLDISNNNVFLLTGRNLYILTFQGKVLQKNQLLNHQLIGASLHASSFASSENNTVYLQDYKKNGLIWQQTIMPFNRNQNRISRLFVINRHQVICAFIHNWHDRQSNSSLIMFDNNGAEIFREQLNRIDDGLLLNMQQHLCIYGGRYVYLYDISRR